MILLFLLKQPYIIFIESYKLYYWIKTKCTYSIQSNDNKSKPIEYDLNIAQEAYKYSTIYPFTLTFRI